MQGKKRRRKLRCIIFLPDVNIEALSASDDGKSTGMAHVEKTGSKTTFVSFVKSNWRNVIFTGIPGLAKDWVYMESGFSCLFW